MLIEKVDAETRRKGKMVEIQNLVSEVNIYLGRVADEQPGFGIAGAIERIRQLAQEVQES